MTTFYDVPAELLIPVLADRLESHEKITQPEWADFVKTGSHKERPPVQKNWWHLRSAAILRKVGRMGPVGVNHLSQAFGGPKNRGVAPNRATAGSRHVIRTSLQQLEDAGLVAVRRNAAGTVNLGRVLTPEGQKLLDEIAHTVRPEAEAAYPGLSKY
ncbi:MAG: 30S ribosomal protein S19e [Euryarchaeota archaeon]|nr:30S ribosomal protein S19e [Euryarchaeota archaeon]|tara:strand:+ start:1042 stop:1512 length:471 start_codon:yes stop_codon:yes gene_type:complete